MKRAEVQRRRRVLSGRVTFLSLVWAAVTLGCREGSPAIQVADRDIEAYASSGFDDCSGCKVVLGPAVTHDTAAVPGVTGSSRFATVNVSGGVILAYGPTESPGQVGVLFPGEQRARLFGTKGDGPNELPTVRAVAFAGTDSLLILGSTSYSYLHLRTGAITRHQLPPGVQSFEVAVDSDRRVIMGNYRPTGYRVAVVGAGSQLLAEFVGAKISKGAPISSVEPTEYHVALLPMGEVVAVPAKYSWAMTRWSLQGDSLGDLGGAPGWFRSFTADDEEKNAEGLSYVLDVQPVGLGFLGVVGRTVDPRPTNGQLPTTEPWHYKYDTAIEIYSILEARIIGRVMIDAVYGTLNNSGHLIRRVLQEDGQFGITVRSIALER